MIYVARRTIIAALTAIMISTGASLGTASVAHADPTSVSQTTATCITSGGGGVAGTPWTGKDPTDCKGEYRLYDISRGRPALIVQVKNTRTVGFKEAVAGDYASAQDWCSDNSLTCSILTAGGFFILGLLVNR